MSELLLLVVLRVSELLAIVVAELLLLAMPRVTELLLLVVLRVIELLLLAILRVMELLAIAVQLFLKCRTSPVRQCGDCLQRRCIRSHLIITMRCKKRLFSLARALKSMARLWVC